MKNSSWVGPLSLMMALSASSCRCSKEDTAGRRGAVASAEVAASADAAVASLQVESFKLDNGMQIDLVDGACGDSSALVVLLNVGVDHDPAGRSGLARVAERVLSQWTGERSGRLVTTGSDYTLYSVVTGGDGLLVELDEVAAWMARIPNEDDLARARSAALATLAKLEGEDAAATAKRLAEQSVSPTRGRGQRQGIADQLEALTLDELQAFWAAHVKPGNAHAVVVGRLDPTKIRAGFTRAFTPLAAGRPAALGAVGDATVKGTLVMGDAPTAVAVAVPAPALSDEQFPAFLLLAARLLGPPGQPAPGRSWQVSYDPIMRPELLFIIGAVGQTEQPEPAAARIRAEVAKVLEAPLTPAEAKSAALRFQLLLTPELLDLAMCAQDVRAFAIARVRRPQLAGAPAAEALERAADQLAAARELFTPKHSASVIAGGALR